MIARQLRLQLCEWRRDLEAFLQHIAIANQRGDRQRFHIHLIKPFLHRRVIDFTSGVAQVPRIAREPARHLLGGDHPHLALRVDHIWPDEKLLRLGMNHPVCRRAAHALRPHDLLQIRRDLIELVTRSKRQMRPIRNDPQPLRPRHHGTRAAFAFGVEHREARVDAADLARFLGGEKSRECHEQQEVGFHALTKAMQAPLATGVNYAGLKSLTSLA